MHFSKLIQLFQTMPISYHTLYSVWKGNFSTSWEMTYQNQFSPDISEQANKYYAHANLSGDSSRENFFTISISRRLIISILPEVKMKSSITNPRIFFLIFSRKTSPPAILSSLISSGPRMWWADLAGIWCVDVGVRSILACPVFPQKSESLLLLLRLLLQKIPPTTK